MLYARVKTTASATYLLTYFWFSLNRLTFFIWTHFRLGYFPEI